MDLDLNSTLQIAYATDYEAGTTQRVTSAIWRIFSELDKPKGTLSKMNSTSIQVSMF